MVQTERFLQESNQFALVVAHRVERLHQLVGRPLEDIHRRQVFRHFFHLLGAGAGQQLEQFAWRFGRMAGGAQQGQPVHVIDIGCDSLQGAGRSQEPVDDITPANGRRRRPAVAQDPQGLEVGCPRIAGGAQILCLFLGQGQAGPVLPSHMALRERLVDGQAGVGRRGAGQAGLLCAHHLRHALSVQRTGNIPRDGMGGGSRVRHGGGRGLDPGVGHSGFPIAWSACNGR